MTKVQGGYILLARKLLTSGIMQMPPLYLKLWIWMLMKASWKDHGNLKRGQLFTSLRQMQEAMSYNVGYRIVKPSIKEIRGVTKFLTKVSMVVTTKVRHGMIITILNYEHYQDAKSYEGHNEGHTKGHNRGTIYKKEGTKERIKYPEKISGDFSTLLERYSDPDLIHKGFEAIASTRKSNRVAESVLLAQLRKWQRYPVCQVERGIRIYLEKDCAGQGKREEYLLGIIRNQAKEPERVSTGSLALDKYYAERAIPS